MLDRAAQRALALKRANQVRIEAAAQRREIKAAGLRDGAIRAAEVVQDASSSMSFFSLLRSVPYVGDQTARRMLNQAGIGPATRVNAGHVDDWHRDRLAGALLSRAHRGQR